MKLLQNLNKVLIVGSFLLCLTSCGKDFLNTRLDTMPKEDNVDNSYSSLLSLANATYVSFQNYNPFSVLDNNLFAPVTDEAIQTNNTRSVLLFNNGNWNQFSNPDDRYNYYYEGINAVHAFFDFLNKVGDYKQFLALNRDTLGVSEKRDYYRDVDNAGWFIAEAHVLRAYYYFELIKRYGGVPLITTIQQPADAQGDYPQRASYDEIVDFIVKEIDDYKNALQPNWTTSPFTANNGRITVGAALAIKARVLLYAASPLNNPSNSVTKWQRAAAAANEALIFAQRTDDAGGKNGLAQDYRQYFLGNNTLVSPETILAQRFYPDASMEINNYPITTVGGGSGVTPSDNLVAAYEYKGAPDPGDPYANRDPRLAATIVTNNSTWNGRTINQAPGGTDDMAVRNTSKTGYYLKKFLNDGLDPQRPVGFPHHWPLFRYSGLLLEYAEAMNEAYGPDNNNGYSLTARGAVNIIRNRPGVGMPAIIAAGQSEFRNAVKQERRIELAFEGHRFWDLLRWKDAETVMNQPIYGVAVMGSSPNFTYTRKVVQNRIFDANKMYLYPLPQSEIAISNGKLIQNPNW